MITEKFPDSYDVRELINLRSTASSAIKSFTASRGILIAAKGKDPYASVISNLILDHQSYLDLRYYAQGGSVRTSISGFNIRIWATPFKTTKDVYDDLMAFRKRFTQRQQLATNKAPKIEISRPEIVGDRIISKFTYQRIVPGKIELLSRYEESVEFSLIPNGGSTWTVLCLPVTVQVGSTANGQIQ